MFGIEEWLGHREMRAGTDFGVEALYFAVQIVGDWIDGDANRKICCSAECLAGPVSALV